MVNQNKFPKNPFDILEPGQRWVPSAQLTISEESYSNLLPPLVHKIRKQVKEWRDKNYEGGSNTSRALLEHWFKKEHWVGEDDERKDFCYFFAQREAVESVIYLYEVAMAKDKYELMKFDSSGRVSTGMFDENWPSYIIKMATGTGKTKVAGLLLAWSYFHKLYESDSDLSQNFLITTPNIIVLDRLKKDFVDLSIFRKDPVIPENGYKDRDWQKDFQPTIHIQDELRAFSESGNIFLTNRHRIGTTEEDEPSLEEEFLGPKPPAKADRGTFDLGILLRSDKIKDLVVLNDETHGVRYDTKWFENIQDIHNQMKLKYGKGISLQLGFSATPKHQDGSIFVQTICDYPLVEAIQQGVVKAPVLPDQGSRARLKEKDSDHYPERFEDYIQLGYEEWRKQYKEYKNTGKIPKLFIMTTTTEQSDDVAKHIQNRYPEFKNAVLTIHTKVTGEISETTSNKEELQILREAADRIDDPASPYKVIVSVLMLREGWDVQTVGIIVGLRPYTHKAKILPEQTIGRGIRKMFGFNAQEELAVIGTEAFIDFVESIKREGVEFGYRPMGDRAELGGPIIVEPDKDNKKKDLEKLDVEIPRLSPRIYKEFKKIDSIQLENLNFESQKIQKFSKEEQREIIFEDLEGKESHRIYLDTTAPDYRTVIKFFTNTILQETRLFSGFDVLYPKVERFIKEKLFGQKVDLSDPNILRNLSRLEVKNTIIYTFRDAINQLTVTDKGGAEIKNYIKLRDARPQAFTRQEYLVPEKSVFNKVVGDSKFELEFASFLDNVSDIISFAKNTYNVHFKIPYQGEDGNIHDYYPDFLVKKDTRNIYIIEIKGRADLDVSRKLDQLIVWCQDANANQQNYRYVSVYVPQEEWQKNRSHIKTFQDIINLFEVKKQYAIK